MILMFNLYRFYQILCAISAIFFIVYTMASPLNANENKSYLQQLEKAKAQSVMENHAKQYGIVLDISISVLSGF